MRRSLGMKRNLVDEGKSTEMKRSLGEKFDRDKTQRNEAMPRRV